ncbi:hypothetical protein I6J77_07145 [Rhodanobacter sp. FDAARGOS 1247]|uniref:hypothetical protein n=1 Tax=Rhodanobacter sp. FDAARGOS 1247 TaxID=2778082 RepID=UPI00195124CE|nr:hypothetical protein [Rhodanobacter sp. FDAARGOS 1247]QRP65199.1 hypothetical protein I6J77_07145 [Rhodanobacter sp. FDAARGOS 1247]
MKIWELRCASINDYAMTVPLDKSDMRAYLFDVNGEPLNWKRVPHVGFADSSRKKHKRPPADVSVMVPGALVLNGRAYAVLGPFLSRFGQLLELRTETGLDPREFYNEAEPGTRYFYNVTHLVPCVDLERSARNDLGHIRLEVFDTTNVPVEAAVFKDPATAKSRIYVNDAGKALIDELVASAGLSGIECAPPRPRL